MCFLEDRKPHTDSVCSTCGSSGCLERRVMVDRISARAKTAAVATAASVERASRAPTPPALGNAHEKRGTPTTGGMSTALHDTFAHLELACNDEFDREPAWFSDDDECFDDDEGFDDDYDEGIPRTPCTPTLAATGFISLADSSTPSTGLTDAFSSDGCASPGGQGFASRIFQSSPPLAPVKRERDPSPITSGESIVAALPMCPMAAIDVGQIPMSLDLFSHTNDQSGAIPVTTTQIFSGGRGKTKKKKEGGMGSADNSDALSCASSSSGVSSCTNASFATTISNGSCYSYMPFMGVPALAFPAPAMSMWQCRDCNIMHPPDYKGCGKCFKKRQEIEHLPRAPESDSQLSSMQQAAAVQAAAAAIEAAAAMNWYSSQLSQAYSSQSYFSPHAYLSPCGIQQPNAPRSSFARSSHSPNTSRRGENVKDNPQMQKTAREGQKHWHEKVQKMRVEYEMANTSITLPQFAEQRYYCTARNLKCQKESLLIFLQAATQKKLIIPLHFVHPADEASGFLGWTGFQIIPGQGDEFRAGVEGLFPEPPKLNTLYHLFRRAGLVPEDWRRAWDGEVPFTWNPNRAS